MKIDWIEIIKWLVGIILILSWLIIPFKSIKGLIDIRKLESKDNTTP
ncbi:MAG: hypothetical protein K9J12_07700 [Melioribacteraceae bacterium]|nr:hypothetical protein [Melioribacteraceae bacterium]MCF8265088.1 hypothetical protein [Melioribacteraceae bacterium]MCF8413780.1 hypothetical protein [Melioribacteraceae bacterium]